MILVDFIFGFLCVLLIRGINGIWVATHYYNDARVFHVSAEEYLVGLWTWDKWTVKQWRKYLHE
jgi:hypothetical protein